MYLWVAWDVLCSYLGDLRIWWRRRRTRDPLGRRFQDWRDPRIDYLRASRGQPPLPIRDKDK